MPENVTAKEQGLITRLAGKENTSRGTLENQMAMLKSGMLILYHLRQPYCNFNRWYNI